MNEAMQAAWERAWADLEWRKGLHTGMLGLHWLRPYGASVERIVRDRELPPLRLQPFLATLHISKRVNACELNELQVNHDDWEG